MKRRTFRRANARASQRGIGALVVVMVLFFVISLVAAYSSRSMIFEQKTSANQYRQTQALEAAEAGIEWGLAMLNSGRIDALCQPGNPADTTFRARYLNIDAASGTIVPTTWLSGGVQTPLNPTCVLSANGWSCNCPANGLPVPLAVPANVPAPAFRLRFIPVGGAAGGSTVVTLVSQGCTRLDDSCLNVNAFVPGGAAGGVGGTGGSGDAVSVLTVQLALKGAIATPPSAALTVRGATIDLLTNPNAQLQVTNIDPAVGAFTIDTAAASVLTAVPSQLTLTTVPGSPPAASAVYSDISLAQPADPTKPDPAAAVATLPEADLMFNTVFGTRPYVYKQQPATIVLTCPADCTAANLATLAQKNPGRVLWLEGDAVLNGPANIGTAAEPVVVVSHGNLSAPGGPVNIFGLLYVYVTDGGSGQWNVGGSPVVQGAAVVEGPILGAAGSAPSFTYDLGVLSALRVSGGSFVRVPGGWQDFQ